MFKLKKYFLYFALIISFFIIVISLNKLKSEISSMNIFVSEYIIFVFLSILLYVIYSKRAIGAEFILLDENQNRMLDFIFFVLIFFAFFSLRDTLYVKPFFYYVFISFAASIVGVKTIFCNKITNKQRNIILTQISILSGIIWSSSWIINPHLVGADSYWHYNTIKNIVSSGHLSKTLAGEYYHYPAYHLINAVSGILSNDFNEVVFGLNQLLLNIGTILAVYLVGKRLSNERVGLLSALLIAISTFYVFGANAFTPRLVVISLFLCFYAISKLERPDIKYWVIFWINALAIFFIHPVTSTVVIAILGVNFFIKFLENYREGAPTPKSSPFLSYLVGHISYMMFVSFSLFRQIVDVLFIREHVTAIGVAALPATVIIGKTFYIESTAAYIGTCIIVFLGVFGALKWLYGAYDVKKINYVLCVGALLLFPASSMLSGKFGIQPTRYLYFIDLWIRVLAAVGLITLLGMINKKRRIAFVFIFLFFLSFFSITSYLTEDDNGLFTKEIPIIPVHSTQSTLEVHKFLTKTPTESTIFLDFTTRRFVGGAERGIYGLPDHKLKLLESESLNKTGLFVVNMNYINLGTYDSKGNNIKLGNEFLDNFKNYGKFYDNGKVQVFKS